MANRLPALLFLGALLSCDEEDVVSLHVRLRPDLSGEVQSTSLVLDDTPAPVENASVGVRWNDRAHLAYAVGSFDSLVGLAIDDLRWSAHQSEGEPSLVRVTIPLGPDRQWTRRFTVSAEERARASATLDPDGKAGKLGATVQIVVELPREAISQGFRPTVRGVEADIEDEVATLTLDLEDIPAQATTLEWYVTW